MLFRSWGQTVQLLPDSKASLIMKSDSLGLIGLAEVPLASPGVAPSPAAKPAANPAAVKSPKDSWGGWENLGGGI